MSSPRASLAVNWATSDNITQSNVPGRVPRRRFPRRRPSRSASGGWVVPRPQGVGQVEDRRLHGRPLAGRRRTARESPGGHYGQIAVIVDLQGVGRALHITRFERIARQPDFHGMVAGRFEALVEVHDRAARRRDVGVLPARRMAVDQQIDL